MPDNTPWTLSALIRAGTPLTQMQLEAAAKHLECLSRVHAELDKVHWTSSVCQEVAGHLIRVGLEFNDPEDAEDDADQAGNRQ